MGFSDPMLPECARISPYQLLHQLTKFRETWYKFMPQKHTQTRHILLKFLTNGVRAKLNNAYSRTM